MDREHQVEQRRLLVRGAGGVVGAQRALLEDRLAQEPPGEQDHPLAPGQGAEADQLDDRAPAGLLSASSATAAPGRRAQPESPSVACQAADGVDVA